MFLPELQHHSLPNGVSLGYRSVPSVPNPALPTLLLLHPFITDNSFFSPQFNDPMLGGEAGKKWNMIAVDIHGHGDTTGRDEFTFWDTATDIALLLDNFNIRNVVICGTSQGGFVATRLALHRPDLVKQIVYAGSTLQLETPESYAGITHLTTGFPYVKENLGLIMQAGFGVDPFAENATAREAEAGKHWISVWNERYSGTPEKEALMQKAVKQLLQRDDIVPRVPELRTMVDVMHGELDSIYKVDVHAEATKKLLEENGILGSYRVVEEGAHYLSWGRWDEVDKKLVEILNAV